MAATASKTPELALQKAEAKTMAEAIANVAQYYPNAILTDKQTAWLGLGVVGITTYGPRGYMWNARMKREAKERAEKRAGVTPPTPEAAHAASFVPPGMPGFIEPVSDAGTM